MSAESRWAAVAALGQSVWYDNVARPALAGGHSPSSSIAIT